METYANNFEQLKTTFLAFLHKLPFYGVAALCLDDPVIKSLLPQVARPVLTYGFQPEADVYTTEYWQEARHTFFEVIRRHHSAPSLKVKLNLPGRHNVLNALAAITVATELKVPDHAILSALASFAGISRRFQVYGEYQLKKGGQVTLVDDYGHHPREIAATLQAARESWPARRVVMVYQPHRYSRTRDLMDDFSQVLSLPDKLLLLEVYSAGETYIEGADTTALIKAIKQRGETMPIFVEEHGHLPFLLEAELEDSDILLMQGAGNIGALAARLAASALTEAS